MQKSKVHAFSAPDEAIEMLNAVATYHRLSKSATITALVKKEFWRIFPGGTDSIKPLKGARTEPVKARKGGNRK